MKKQSLTLDSLFFSTPHQKILRLLVANPTTVFNMRAISSKLKGVRGLGGATGIMGALRELGELELVDFVDNDRAVRIRDEGSCVRLLKIFLAVCDLQGLAKLLAPVSAKGMLFGSRATGKAHSDSDYDLFVVSDTPEEIKKVASRHPMAKDLELIVVTPKQYENIAKQDPELSSKLSRAIELWASAW